MFVLFLIFILINLFYLHYSYSNLIVLSFISEEYHEIICLLPEKISEKPVARRAPRKNTSRKVQTE